MFRLIKTWMTPKPALMPSSLLRKISSEQQLLQQGIKVDTQLLCLPEVDACQFRTSAEIVNRIQSLMLLTAYAEEAPPAVLDSLCLRVGPQQHFTLSEQQWLANAKRTTADKQACLWRYESISLLLWALGYRAELGPSSEVADIIGLSRLIQWQTYDELLAGARLRPFNTLLDMADIYYRMAQLAKHQPRALPVNINQSIVRERYACLSWLLGEVEWDELFAFNNERAIR